MFPIALAGPGRSLPLVALVAFLAGPLFLPRPLRAAPLTDFAFSLQSHLAAPDRNLVWSPTCLGQALAMLYGGTSGVTRAEMARVLLWPADPEATQSAWGGALRDLAGRGAGSAGVEGRPFQLSLAGAVWPAEGLPLRPGYLAGLRTHFGVTIQPLPFQTNSERARLTINDWVAARTDRMIPELLDSGFLSPGTRLVLTTAAYLNARWAQPFEEVHEGRTFTRLDGRVVPTLMMERRDRLASARGPGWGAVALPYQDARLEMVLVVPDSDFRRFEQGWTPQKFREITDRLALRDTELALPPFRLDADLDLTAPLSAAGLRHLFDGADLSGLADRERFFVNKVVQKAVLRVGREGTVAAAATAIELRELAILEDNDLLRIQVDRPFLFVLRDRPTGAILFMGRVVDPTT